MRGNTHRLTLIAILIPFAGCAPVLDSSNDPANPTAITDSTGSPVAAERTSTIKTASVSPRPLASVSPNFLQTAGSLEALDASDKSLSATGTLPFVRSKPVSVDPFPIVLNHSVEAYVDQYLAQPEALERSFKRSSPYMAEMVSLFRDRGLPEDLVYLTFAESAFSKDGAGPWQLTRETARRFGLVVNNWVDERRDPVKSTRAAADYLSTLHQKTGDDWRMTLIAWNNGENGVNRYMDWSGSSYDRLLARLPYRTRALMNRFMAVAFIAKRHHEFGIDASDTARPPSYRVMGVRGGTALEDIAEKVHTSLAVLRGLNPGLLRGRTPPSPFSYPVRVPQEPLRASL